MKKKTKIILAIILMLALLMTPIRLNSKDGKGVRYKSIVYEISEINKEDTVKESNDGMQYIEGYKGYEIKIFGIVVYRSVWS